MFFKDGSSTEKIEVEYPLGHRRRRDEGIPVLIDKFKNNLNTIFSSSRSEDILKLCLDENKLQSTSIIEFMDLFIPD